MTKRINSLLWLIAITVVLFASQIEVVAQAKIRRYEVSDKGNKLATVVTSASNQMVSVSVERKGKPVHYYRTYVQLPVTEVRIGDRQQVFSIYHKTGDIVAEDYKLNVKFNLNIARISGVERSQRNDVKAIRKQFAQDMHILRAVRAYDATSDVELAELAYVIVTYDDSIMNSEAPASLTVNEATAKNFSKTNNAKIVRAAFAIQSNTLDGCMKQVDADYNDCVADKSFSDKTVCHNNRVSGRSTCYSTYGSKVVAPEESLVN